ncbi:MAG: flagellar hook-basal body complex protein FliE [Methylococcales bacterium]|nr:flagellar hook-basal body complex protein FliE [Methylococcales bacterium]
MSHMNVEQVLAQMRTMSVEAAGKPAEEAADDRGLSFSAILKDSIDAVNQVQKTSAELSSEFEMGNQDVSLAEVMIAAQKSAVSFQAMLQVRNKLVDAYKDIMNMPL